jgi:DNA ligase-1
MEKSVIKYDTLYHIDENDNVRIWYMEQEGNKYRAVSGIENGKLVISEWKEVFGKNVGKANATTDEEQAAAEVAALYTKKIERKYHTSKDSIGQGSKIIEPMLADKYKKWDKTWTSVFSQPKLDGMRCIATINGLFSRQGKPIVSVPHIQRALAPLFESFPELVLDGELYNHTLRDNFNELLSLARQSKPTQEDWDNAEKMIEYHVYDNMDDDVFADREFNLHTVIMTLPLCIQKVQTTEVYTQQALDEEYAELLADGYEGQMVRLNTKYENKRSKSLMKRKEFIDEEFEIIEILEGQGNWAGYAKSVMCKTKNGVVFSAGIKGNQEFTKELLHRRPVPKTATIRYQNMTPDGSLRFPIAVAFYENERDV